MLRKKKPRKPSVVGRVLVPLAAVVAIVTGVALVITLVVIPLWQERESAGWQPAQCTVTRARFYSTRSDDDVTYRVQFRYQLLVEGRPYHGHRLDFVDDTSEEEDGVLQRRYPSIGSVLPCWYDPADPLRNVIHREGWRGITAFSPLAAFAIAIALFLRRGHGRLHEHREGSQLTLSRRNTSGMVVWFTLSAAILFDTLGLGAPNRFGAIVMLALGAVPTILFVYKLCAYFTKVAITIPSKALQAGDRIAAAWSITGPVRPRRVVATMVGREVVRWQEGSNARIDIKVFHERDAAESSVPPDAVPSLSLGGNSIEWSINVNAELPMWPDVALTIPLDIRGKPGPEQDPPPIARPPARSKLALMLDGDRGVFAPGDEIAGTLAWTRDAIPKSAKLMLWWESKSQHAQHREVVGEAEVAELPRLIDSDPASPYRGTSLIEGDAAPLAAAEQRRLRFTAPDAPYTYDGKLFEVTWGLELVVDGERTTAPVIIDGTRSRSG